MTAPQTNDSLPLVDPKQFESPDLQVNLINISTNTEIRGNRRIFSQDETQARFSGDEDVSISVIEFLEEGLVLSIPKNTCAQGHRLKITIDLRRSSSTREFEFAAEVENTDVVSDTREAVSIQFTQFNPEEWASLLNTFEKRQSEIDEFLHDTKN